MKTKSTASQVGDGPRFGRMVANVDRRLLNKIMLGLLAAVIGGGVAAPTAAIAQQYPSKAVRLVVPFAPGGPTDFTARVVGEKLGKILGAPVVIENLAGAGTVIGTRSVAQAQPDGYTLLYGSTTLGLNPTLRPNLPYDTLKAFQPIGMVAHQPFVFVVHPSVPVKSVKEFVAYAKANPGKINFGTAGIGTGNHLAQELFSILSDTKLQHVPYQSDGEMVLDVIAGRVQMTITSVPPLLAHIQSGALRPLGVSSTEPLDQLPDVPPISSSGVPGYTASAWNAVMAPAGLDSSVASKLTKALEETLKDQQVREVLIKNGVIPFYASPQETRAFLEKEIERWGSVIKERNIKVQ